MIDDYKKFLAPKETTWRKAKQLEYSSLDKILLSLEDLESLTTRNSMTLRILGLVKVVAKDDLELTPAGEKLINSRQREKILDEQLLKIYLDSFVNPSLHIPVYPLAIIFQILHDLEYITFDEYKLFVCWIHDEDETPKVIEMIKHLRGGKGQRQAIQALFESKVRELGVSDFDDNVYRLYAMFILSSFITIGDEAARKAETFFINSSPEVYERLAQSVHKLDGKNYEDVQTNILDLINEQPEHTELAKQLKELSNEDVGVLTRQVKERRALPDIMTVKPVAIAPRIVEKAISLGQQKAVSHKKIDYAARDTRNRLVGRFGEQIVHKFEYERLVEAGRSDLAVQIDPVSERDDSLGYDLESFNDDGTKLHIEVKSVKGQPRTFSFFISKNELEKVRTDSSHRIYIVFDYESTSPKVWPLPHLYEEIDQKLITVDPINFRVTMTIE